jgi:hypothetical protein
MQIANVAEWLLKPFHAPIKELLGSTAVGLAMAAEGLIVRSVTMSQRMS